MKVTTNPPAVSDEKGQCPVCHHRAHGGGICLNPNPVIISGVPTVGSPCQCQAWGDGSLGFPLKG